MFGKSHAELRPILEAWKVSREHWGAPNLKKFETDNVASDKGLLESIFEELRESVIPFDPNPEIPSTSFSLDSYRFFTSEESVDLYILANIEHFKSPLSGDKCHYGCDSEFNRHSHVTALLQLSFYSLPVLVLHFIK